MRTPLNIALVTAFPPGKNSLNEYGYHLAKGFAAHPEVERVTIIADCIPDDLPESDLGPKVSILRTWKFNRALTGVSILRALRQCAPDCVVWNLQTATFGDREIPAALGLLAPAGARLMGIPSGVIAHNIIAGIDLETTHLKGAPIRQWIVRTGGSVVTRAMLGSTYCTVTLGNYFDALKHRYPRAPVHLVPHGTFDRVANDHALIADRPARIVTMGKFGTYKRLETLLDAFSDIKSRQCYEGLELLIGGGDHPSTPGYMADLAKTYQNSPGVIFRGYVAEDEIPDFFSTARISVFDYSATTGSSGVLHQTASFGCVPIFPRIGDFVDLCEDEGLTGRHYEPGNATEMARAICGVLDDPAGAQKIADSNAEAASDMPFSDVIDFHIRHMRNALENDLAPPKDQLSGCLPD